jgi:hypothetical protein
LSSGRWERNAGPQLRAGKFFIASGSEIAASEATP